MLPRTGCEEMLTGAAQYRNIDAEAVTGEVVTNDEDG
jgi:hypothetical protein